MVKVYQKFQHVSIEKNYVLDQKTSKKRGIFGLFRHYSRKTLRNFSVLIRLSPNLQGGRPIGRTRCANNKNGHFDGKKITFQAKKRQKNAFFRVFTHYRTKMLRIFTVLLRSCSNLQGSRPIECTRCANFKKGHFVGKKITFQAKKRQKNAFFRVFTHYRTKTLRIFTVLLRWRSNLQGSRPIGSTRCANIKNGQFDGKKFTFQAKKRQKNAFFRVFTHYRTETLRIFTVLLRWCSNLQGSRPIGSTRCASIKNGQFDGKKFTFQAKKRQKNAFFRVFAHYRTKMLRIFTVLLRWCSNLQGSRPIGCTRCANFKNGHFIGKKITFQAKKHQKKRVFRGFHTLPH